MANLLYLSQPPSLRSAAALASHPTISEASLTWRTSFGEYSYINRYSINLRSFICRSTRELWKMVSEVSWDRIIPSVNKGLSVANRTPEEVPPHVRQVSVNPSNIDLAPAPAWFRPGGEVGQPIGSHFMGDHLPSTTQEKSYKWCYEIIANSLFFDGKSPVIRRKFLRKNCPSNPVCSLHAHISNAAQSNIPSFFMYENPYRDDAPKPFAQRPRSSYKRGLARRQDGR